MMLSITGDADCCNPNCQGEGWPRPARAGSPAARTARIVANKVDRLSSRIIAPSMKLSSAQRRSEPPPASGHSSVAPRRDLGGILASQTIIPAPSQCTLSYLRCDEHGPIRPCLAAVVRPFLGHNALFY